MISRRPHKKSRKGCSECKRRHIRCDEQHPHCINCSRAERVCSYAVNASEHQTTHSKTSSPATNGDNASLTPPSEHTSRQVILAEPFDLFGDQNHNADPGDADFINMNHLELFDNFRRQEAEFANIGEDMPPKEVHNAFVKAAFSAPYLMYECLAFSARQLSVEGAPEKTGFYVDQAMKLQTRALALFNGSSPVISEETCIPMFLFSSVLGQHILADTLAFRDHSLEPFLSRFLNYLGLHRGVKSVCSGHWPVLLTSELRPVLLWGSQMAQAKGHGEDCTAIRELILRSSDLSEGLRADCIQAIEHLQWALDQCEQPSSLVKGKYMTFTWPLLISHDFTEFLGQRRPEALVILSYYGVLLHRFRDFWIVGGAGRHLISLITAYLGSQWKPWLEWPNEMVRYLAEHV
ncbi:hypothetical protein F5B20DRAFT_239975 [Whalleya microplaca]|nr:hypothetical protein F5B20DRAFT_239975 [Whalleya microplaca]